MVPLKKQIRITVSIILLLFVIPLLSSCAGVDKSKEDDEIFQVDNIEDSKPANIVFVAGGMRFRTLDADSVEIIHDPNNIASLFTTRGIGNKPLVIPTTIYHDGETYIVRSIGEYAFSYLGDDMPRPGEGGDLPNTIIIPETVETIGSYAFSRYHSMTAVQFPERTIHIGDNAFERTPWLQSLGELEDDFVIFNNILFKYIGNDSIVTIPQGVSQIYSAAFYENKVLTEVIIPEGVTRIGSDAFFRCNNLVNVTIPSSVTFFGDRTFNGTPWLESMTDEFVIVNDILLQYGGTGTEAVIPQGVIAIGGGAFRGARNLINLTIPDSVTSIGGFAFADCSNLHNIELPDSITNLEIGAFARSSFHHITIPSGITHIRADTFYLTSKLETIELPEGLVHIESRAFYSTGRITEITIPRSINHVGESAFIWGGFKNIYTYNLDILEGVRLRGNCKIVLIE